MDTMTEQKARVLHIHVLPVITGSGINTFLTMDGLKEKYQMEMACAPGGPLNELVVEHGMTVHPIKNFVSEMAFFKDLHALWQVYRLLRKRRFDLVHTHNSKGGFIGRFAAFLASGPPVIHGVHGFAFHQNEPWLRRTLFFTLEKIAKYWSAKVICISQPLVDLWVQCKLAAPEKISKIYSGIEVNKFKKKVNRSKIRKELGLDSKDIAIGQVSKLWEGKGHEDIINAAPALVEKVPQAKIIFIGEGPLLEKLQKMTTEKNVQDNFIFLGYRSNIPELTQALDIAVLASHFEGMGRVILEAMAVGLPIVASRVGGIVDLVIDNETGLLVDPHTPSQLTLALTKLAQDPDLRKKMGALGQQRVDERFTSAMMIDQIDSLYKEVLSQK